MPPLLQCVHLTMDDRENASQPIKTGLAPISIWCLQRGKTKEEYANSKKDRRENKVQDSIDTKHAVSTEDDCHYGHACCCNVTQPPNIHCFSPRSQRTRFILLSIIQSSYCTEIKCNAAPYLQIPPGQE